MGGALWKFSASGRRSDTWSWVSVVHGSEGPANLPVGQSVVKGEGA